jgi:PIN domain nuclease of toxin-antitoxin system
MIGSEPLLPLAITHHHGRKGAALSPLHKDPFDRLLVAPCHLERMTLVTQDKMLGDYGIPIRAA